MVTSNIAWQQFYPNADLTSLQTIIAEREKAALQQCRQQAWPLDWQELASKAHWYLDKDTVVIDSKSELSSQERDKINSFLKLLVPWKKGPFRIFGSEIDAEWRSDLKWQRLVPAVGSLQGKKVADIGCNNGYFMFQILASGAAHVLGFEPFFKHWYSFRCMQTWLGLERATIELLGVEHIDLFAEQFDVIFCLGILYHHTDPVGLLRKIRQALVKGGHLFIDCQGIPGTDPVALVPASRYAGARGIWFLPTLSCLKHWIRRAGFQTIDEIYSAPLSSEEQRATSWAPIKSLADYLDLDDPSQTIEGYPAPWRFYLRVR